MNSRERVRNALAHRQPDCTPLDFGGCGQTGINASTLYKLRKAYGLEEHPIRVIEPFQMLGEIEMDLLEKVGGDVVPLLNPGTMFGTSNRLTKLWHMPDSTPVYMSDNFEYDEREDGTIFAYPQGNRSVAPSMQMPAGGSFFDCIQRAPAVDEDHLTPLEDFKDQYTVHTEETCRYWEENSRKLFEETEYSILGVVGGMGLGDAGEMPGEFLLAPKGIRRMDEWLMAHYLHPEYIKAVFGLQTEIALKNLELYRQATGDRVDTIWLSGTDFGTQNSLFFNKQIFIDLYKPFYKKVNDWVHTHTKWKTFFHTCGAIYDLIPELIDCGMDIMNPVQTSCHGMEPERLKEEFGDKVIFWGGGVNTQQTLPVGTPKEVYDEVTKRLEIFSPGGGFVFATVHNVVSGVPPENLLALFEAIHDFRKGQISKV
ncbi:methyltransferase [Clostridia bacterium]|nr:methyltransferase [Clostridia bacterium]